MAAYQSAINLTLRTDMAGVSGNTFQVSECQGTNANVIYNIYNSRNPSDKKEWDVAVQTYLMKKNTPEPELIGNVDLIRMSGLRRWKVPGPDGSNVNASGSTLYFEHFLHFRALIKQHEPWEFEVESHVDGKYQQAATAMLKRWDDFRHYIDEVDDNDPSAIFDHLGSFDRVKSSQNQCLLNSFVTSARAIQPVSDGADDEERETPVKRRTGSRNYSLLNDKDAEDEQIVNDAIIQYAQTLTRRWMTGSETKRDPSPTPEATGSKSRRTTRTKTLLADWKMSRDRFYIMNEVDYKDNIQIGHLKELFVAKGNKAQGRTKRPWTQPRHDDFLRVGKEEYAKLLVAETDGSLFSIDNDEKLAIVEAKKRVRTHDQLKIEWQESAEILAWLNARIRDEIKSNKSQSVRRGVLRRNGERR